MQQASFTICSSMGLLGAFVFLKVSLLLPLFLTQIFLYRILDWPLFSSFSTLKTLFHWHPAYSVSMRNLQSSLSFFVHNMFFICWLNLGLNFCPFIFLYHWFYHWSIWLCVLVWFYSCFLSLGFSGFLVGLYFSSNLENLFSHYFFKYFFCPHIFRDFLYSCIRLLNVTPQLANAIFIFNSFFLCVLFQIVSTAVSSS